MANRPFLALSHSQIKASFCPQLYKARYIDATGPEPTSRQALKGTIGHAIAAEYIAALYRFRWTKSLDLYTEILMRHIEPYDDEIKDAVQAVGRFFVDGFVLRKNALYHRTELLLAMTRDFEPVAVTAVGAPGEMPPQVSPDETQHVYLWDDALHRVIDPPCDGFTGKLDYICPFKRGRECDITDFKLGQLHVTPQMVRKDPQLMLYAALWLANNPDCERVNVILWGVAYGAQNKADFTWTRETAYPLVKARGDLAFQRISTCYEVMPAGEPWPPLPFPVSCEWCSMALQCGINNAASEYLEQSGPCIIPRRKPMRKEKPND